MRGWQRIVVLGACALLVALCSSCGGGGGTEGGGGGDGTAGGFLKIGSTVQIDSLNPFVAFNQDPYIIFQYEYPSLVQYDTDTLELVPDFATSWSHSPDYTQWTFKTAPNAKWSDGQPLTAEDAVWNFSITKKFEDGPTANSAGYLKHMTKAAAPDANTVVLNFDTPSMNFLADLDQAFILPEHVWTKCATGDGAGLKHFANTPEDGKPVVSGGPFMMTEYVPDQVAKFEVNPNWYGPKPNIDGWGLQYFATDDAAVQALKTGQIDVVWTSVPTTAIDTLKSDGFTVSVTPNTQYRDLIFNSNPAKLENRELLDPKLREAIAHAIDRQSIVDTAWNGYGEPGYSIVPPASGNDPMTGKPWTDPSLKPETFDLDLAAQMLDDAGYKMGPEGYRQANDLDMKYEVIFPHGELGSGMRSFQIVQQDLKKIGIGISARVLNDNAAWQATIADKYRQFDLTWWDWQPNVDPGFILSVLRCDQWYSWNDSGYCNKEYDKLEDQQAAARSPQERIDAIYQMQKMIYEQRPYIVLNYNDNTVAWSKAWTGFVPSSLGEFNPLSKQTLLGAHRF